MILAPGSAVGLVLGRDRNTVAHPREPVPQSGAPTDEEEHRWELRTPLS